MSEEKNKVEYDEKVMQALLNEPDIKGKVAQMNPETLTMYKKLLVTQGVYARYQYELNMRELGSNANDLFASVKTLFSPITKFFTKG